MFRNVTLAAVVFGSTVLALAGESLAQNNYISPAMMARQYSPVLVAGYANSPYFRQYGYHETGWRNYLQAHANLANAHANLANAHARQVDTISQGIALENRREAMHVARERISHMSELKQQRQTEFASKAESRRAAYERLKARKAAERQAQILAESADSEQETLAKR